MELQRIGQSDLEIAPLVFGGNVFGWTLDKVKSFQMLDQLVDNGITMIDSADVYSVWAPGNKGGESESLIGQWLSQSQKRDKVVIATKVGQEMGDGSKGLTKKHIIKSAEDSLKRLKTDVIDVYYAHIDDKNVPFEETLLAFQQLQRDGKIRHIASSNYAPERLDAILKFAQQNDLPQYIAHQPEYNLFDRQDYEENLESICKAHNLGVLTYFSLASGFLTGKYRSEEDMQKSNRGADFLKKYATPRGWSILEALDQVAAAHSTSAAAVSLAWIINRQGITAPIASATSPDQLQQLIAATRLKLTDDQMSLLNKASRKDHRKAA